MTKTLTAVIDRQYGKTLRAVLYLRVSTEEQVKGYGLGDGEKKCRAYAERSGWDVVDVYTDPGVSGKLQAADRPDLKRLMQDAAKGAFDVVVVSEARVIGRTDRAYYTWVWELEDRGIFVADAKTGLDNTTEQGREAMREEANYAFKEYTRIRTRTQNGIQEKALEGGYAGGKPKFGYRIEDLGKKGLSRQVPDLCDGKEACLYEDGSCLAKHEAVTLRTAQKLVVEHEGDFHKAALALNGQGRTTRTGKLWTGGDLRIVLMREDLLKAQVRFRAVRSKRPERESVVIKLTPIFTPEEIADLKSAAKPRKRHAKRAEGFILSRRVDSLCGSYYVGRGRHYMCRERTHKNTCDCPAILADRLDGLVKDKLRDLLVDADRLKALAQEWAGLTAGTRANYLQRLTELDQRIEELQDTIDLTMASAAASAARRKLDREEAEKAVERALRPLEKELQELERSKADVISWQAETTAAEGRADQLQEMADVARRQLGGFTPRQWADFLEVLDFRITVTGQRREPSTRSKVVLPPMRFTMNPRAGNLMDDTSSAYSWASPACVIGRFSMAVAA